MNRVILLAAITALAVGSLVAQQRRMEMRRVSPQGDMATLAAGGEHAFFHAGGMRLQGAVVKDAPYIAESVSESVQTLADGNRIRRETRTKVYRDSEGRTRREETIGALGPWSSERSKEVVFIHDPVAGESWMLLPDEQKARKMGVLHVEKEVDGAEDEADVTVDFVTEDVSVLHAGTEDLERRQERIRIVTRHAVPGSAGADDPGVEQLGERMIEGVKAQGTRITSTIPAGTIGNERPLVTTYERWHSPELQVDVLVEHNEPRVGKRTQRLVGIQRVEPSPLLFAPPPNYDVVDARPAGDKSGTWIMKRREKRE